MFTLCSLLGRCLGVREMVEEGGTQSRYGGAPMTAEERALALRAFEKLSEVEAEALVRRLEEATQDPRLALPCEPQAPATRRAAVRRKASLGRPRTGAGGQLG